jgi:hypothetical protein
MEEREIELKGQIGDLECELESSKIELHKHEKQKTMLDHFESLVRIKIYINNYGVFFIKLVFPNFGAKCSGETVNFFFQNHQERKEWKEQVHRLNCEREEAVQSAR